MTRAHQSEDAAAMLLEMVMVFVLRFDPPNSVESHQIKARAAKARIVHRQLVKAWRGPFRMEVRQ